MDKLEKIKGDSVNEVDEITENVNDPIEEKKERRFFSLFTFWKKIDNEQSDDFEVITEEKEKKGIRKYINLRTGALVASVAVIAVAGYVNLRYSEIPEIDSGINAGALEELDATVTDVEDGSTDSSASEDYFALSVINRQRVRDEAMEILLDLTNSDATDAEAKAGAYNEMTRMANEITNEANIESLVKAKGFSNCVAVVSKDDVNVVVESDGLTVNEVAQIKEIVYLECGVHPDNVKIIEKAGV